MKVEEKIVGEIKNGLVVLVGFTKTDNESIVQKAVDKLLKIRLWKGLTEEDKLKSWQTNVVQNNYEILLVSQFTLYSVMKGNKPDFHQALGSEDAIKLYETMIKKLKENYKKDKIQTGKFGEMMQVEIVNEGPVTIELEYN